MFVASKQVSAKNQAAQTKLKFRYVVLRRGEAAAAWQLTSIDPTTRCCCCC